MLSKSRPASYHIGAKDKGATHAGDPRCPMCGRSSGRLQLRAQLQRIRPSITGHVQQLIAEAPGGVVLGVGEVQCLEEHTEVAVDVVARAEVDFGRRLEEGRLRAELRAVLLLTEGQELP